MATEEGSEVVASASASSTTVAAPAKSCSTGNLIVAKFKWEVVATPTLASVADTAGNTYVVEIQQNHGSGEPRGAIAYAKNITGHATNVVTGTFSSAAIWRVISVECWSGLDTTSPIDGTATSNSGSGTSYTTSAITLSASGLVVGWVGGYTTTTGKAAGGSPAFTVGNTTLTDSFGIRLVDGSGSKTPAASVSTGSNNWVMLAVGFKDAAGGGGSSARFFAGIIGAIKQWSDDLWKDYVLTRNSHHGYQQR
jgi:hypothetical protein